MQPVLDGDRRGQGGTARTWVIALSGLLLALGSGNAQEPKPNLGSPGPEHKKLDILAGHWDVTVVFPTGPGKTSEGTARCEAKWTLDGRFLRLEYTSMFAGKPLTVVRYVGFDRHKGAFVEVQFESTRTDVLMTSGSMGSDGKTITTHGTHRDPATGKELKVRSVTTLINPDEFTLELFYGEGASAQTITLKHRRSKQP